LPKLGEQNGSSYSAEKFTNKRPNSNVWQCSTYFYFAGKNRRMSTKEGQLSKAKEIAEEWYLQLRGKLRNGEIKTQKTFREASERYLRVRHHPPGATQ